jgi:Flp pilus assembly protein protease CpaA
MRSRLAATVGLMGLVLFYLGTGLTPAGGDTQVGDLATGQAALAEVQRHLTLLRVSGVLVVVGLMAMTTVVPAISSTIRGRGAGFATAAAAVGAFGCFGAGWMNSRIYLDMDSVARSTATSPSGSGFLSFLEHGSAVAAPAGIGEFFALPLSMVLLAVALWRSRSVPRWFAVALPVALAVGFSAQGIAGVVVGLPWLAAMGYLLVRVVRSNGGPDVPTRSDVPELETFPGRRA